MSDILTLDTYPAVTSSTAVGGVVPPENIARAVKDETPSVLKNQMQNALSSIENKKQLLDLLRDYKEQKDLLEKLAFTCAYLKGGLTEYKNEIPSDAKQPQLDKIIDDLAQANKTLVNIRRKIRHAWFQNSDIDYSARKHIRKYWHEMSMIIHDEIEETVANVKKLNFNVDFGQLRKELKNYFEDPSLEGKLLVLTNNTPSSLSEKISRWFQKNKKINEETLQQQQLQFTAICIVRLQGGDPNDSQAVRNVQTALATLLV